MIRCSSTLRSVVFSASSAHSGASSSLHSGCEVVYINIKAHCCVYVGVLKGTHCMLCGTRPSLLVSFVAWRRLTLHAPALRGCLLTPQVQSDHGQVRSA
jgi:hypothetical protein